MKKILLLSDEFDYAKMITHDAGPGYAGKMGWTCTFLEKRSHYLDHVNLIDSRITERECEILEDHIATHQETLFVPKIVDPGGYYREHWFYRFLFRIKDRENVYYLSTYPPTDLVKELDDATGNRKMVFIPFPFQDSYTIDPALSPRHKQVIFSGARHPHIYPERQAFLDGVRHNPLLWGKVHHLKHPGYPDNGQRQRHAIVGERYMNYLSQFRWMFVSPSRYGLELLKYSECAYARCVPVGQVPHSFSARLQESFISLDFDHLGQSLRRVFSMPLTELQEIARAYYQAMAEERHPDRLNAHLDDFLAGVHTEIPALCL
ncbi:hypothetical protein BST81_21470 [Leptolyngbya sp. 'hensonii']|uniref:hypothetical protein n=1 Tax=Leptolyngbya sp. 'hensonii' TaxID=1922337 RepID=UPI00094FB9DA|nr:hypothetical protein [Leptolyngbya sp. 'hensonii']OLP16363.1 hypothetical protein BST81_21470 [Leptolyngbya sp. 'hensonii']